MTDKEVKKLLKKHDIPGQCSKPELVETHISWVILCDDFAYKIKKPVKYSFLDFTTLEKRKYFCKQELALNLRLTDIYKDVLPVNQNGKRFNIGGEGEVVDYAVQMKRIDSGLEMDCLLVSGEVSVEQIQQLAGLLAAFHLKAARIDKPFDGKKFQKRFNDISIVAPFLQEEGYKDAESVIRSAIDHSDVFQEKYSSHFQKRIEDGWLRDVHGDLHAANIFLTSPPIVFDCIEFNDEFRQIDILEEIAFFYMDLESYGAHDLAKEFLDCYQEQFQIFHANEDELLFQYFKLYRANVKVKVQALKAQQAGKRKERQKRLKKVGQYFNLLKSYLG